MLDAINEGVTKHCPGCKQVKGASEFHKNMSKASGLADYCKECRKEEQRKGLETNRLKNATAPKVFAKGAAKTCPRCGVEKLVGEFGSDRTTPDGLSRSCKDCQRARDNQRDNTPEGRAKMFLRGQAKRLKEHLGSGLAPKETAVEYLDGGNPYARWRIDGIIRLQEEGDRLYGRGNYQLDHGVAIINGGCPFSLDNIRPVPTAKHAKKTGLDVKLHTLRGTDPRVEEAKEEVLSMIENYCTSVPFAQWTEQVFQIAENWQDAEELLANCEEIAEDLGATPLFTPPLPSPSLIALAKGMMHNNERDMAPVKDRNRMDYLYPNLLATNHRYLNVSLTFIPTY